MRRASRCRARLLLPALVLCVASPAAADEPRATDAVAGPLSTDLLEQAATRLVQVDITVSGPADEIGRLGVEDIEIRANFRRVTEFILDGYCETRPPGVPIDTIPGEVARPDSAPTTFMLYFDQPHLTMAGRQRSIDVAQQILPALLQDGNRAMIVSNSDQQIVIEPMTEDPQRLIEGLERLERDRTQWNLFATEEQRRVEDVIDVLNEDGDTSRAISRARSYQRRERWHTEKHLRRVTLALARLGDAPVPKALIYFGDTLRSNPGEHYLTFFGSNVIESSSLLERARLDSFSGALPFDQLVNEASAQGIRIFAVEAAGLTANLDSRQPAGRLLGQTLTVPASSRTRLRDSKTALRSLAAETGGRAFLNGIRPERIVSAILDDLRCVYIASFDPGELKQDRPLRLSIKSKRDGVRVRARGRLVVKSESARLTSRLLAALAAGDQQENGIDVASTMLPTGYAKGRYTGLLQIRVPPTGLTSSTWDLGASLLTRDEVREEISARFEVVPQGVTVVLEREVRLQPGSHQVYAIAHESTSDYVLSRQSEFTWPDPDAGSTTLAPIALMQSADAVFRRDGEPRTHGTLMREASEAIDVARPTALVGLVCRAKRKRGPRTVERQLIGGTTVDFPVLEIDLQQDRCAQVRDLIPSGLLAPGRYTYRLEVSRDGDPEGSTSRSFNATSWRSQ